MEIRIVLGAYALGLALTTSPSVAQRAPQDGLRVDAAEADIREVIERAYVRGLHANRDEAAVRGGFYPEFIMSVLDGEGVIVVPLEMWLERLGLDGQPNDQPVEGRFVLVDVTGETAVAKLEVHEGGEHVYTDYFGLYRFPTGWKIVNKLFQSGPGGS